MSRFWAGYVVGRRGGGDSVPPGLALFFAALLGLAAVMFALTNLARVVGTISRSHPFVSLLAVGLAAAGIGRAFGVDSEFDSTAKIIGPGAIGSVSLGILWVIGTLAGGPNFDQTPLVLKIPMTVLSLVIVGGLGYMVLSVVRYRCQTERGRRVRTASFVFLACWVWTSVFHLPLSTVPLLGPDALLALGIVAAFGVGFAEVDSPSKPGAAS